MEIQFKIGCAVWAYKGWLDRFFPTGSRPSEFLSLYSHRFPVVEGNTTFYGIPDAKTLDRWVEQTPEGFEFCPKVPKALSHGGMLTESIAASHDFLGRMQRLRSRLGPVLLQLPPTYSPENLPDLEAFLAAWDRRAPLAVEVRHPDWFNSPHAEKLSQQLQHWGAGRAILDSRPVYSAEWVAQDRKKPQLPLTTDRTADLSFVRFVAHPHVAHNANFIAEWVSRIETWLQQGTIVYFFVHCPIEDESVDIARSIRQQLADRGVDVPPFPWKPIAPSGQQLSLF